jgi:hypothetical protein
VIGGVPSFCMDMQDDSPERRAPKRQLACTRCIGTLIASPTRKKKFLRQHGHHLVLCFKGFVQVEQDLVEEGYTSGPTDITRPVRCAEIAMAVLANAGMSPAAAKNVHKAVCEVLAVSQRYSNLLVHAGFAAEAARCMVALCAHEVWPTLHCCAACQFTPKRAWF